MSTRIHNFYIALFAILFISILSIGSPKSTAAGSGERDNLVRKTLDEQSLSLTIVISPTIDSLIPDHTVSGGSDFTLQVQGQGFITNTLVSWNNLDRPTTYISTTLVQATIYSSDIITPGVVNVHVTNPPPVDGESNSLDFIIYPHYIFLPITSNYFPPIPRVPSINQIDNSSQNNVYTVSWNSTQFATAYRLQEATVPDFINAVSVYDNTGLSWTTTYPGKAPGTYYYRVQAYNSYGTSDWSVPTSVTVYPLTAPSLNTIDNSDQNITYGVSWSSVAFATAYRLQESTDSAFTNVTQVYAGPGLSWLTPNPGKFPGNYYYRVQSYNYFGSSDWSSPQFVTIHPLFVGLNLRWDGSGYIRGSEYADIGSHETLNLDALTEPDTIRCNDHLWYDPNPYAWEDSYATVYYSVLTGNWKGSSSPGDPSWKWGSGWFLPYNLQLSNNSTVTIDGQPFTVTGPHTGVTSWGRTIQYWQFVNKNKFLFWDGDPDWKQFVHAGEAVLRYDAGNSRLLLYSSIKRHWYYLGDLTQDTVQYIENLSSATSIPGSPGLNEILGPNSSTQTTSTKTMNNPSKGKYQFQR
jgi:hypothetical protein